MVAIGASAFYIALKILKEKNRDKNTEVLVFAWTFIVTLNACLHAELKHIFVNINVKNIHWHQKRLKKIISNTMCIRVVHIFDFLCDMDEVILRFFDCT